MPYKIVNSKGKWFVRNEDTGELKPEGGYDTREEALKFLRALYANVKKSISTFVRPSFFNRTFRTGAKLHIVKEIEEINPFDMLIYFEQNTIKSFDVSDGIIGAYSIIFGNEQAKDFHGNWFTKNTFLGHTRGDGAVVTINHRIPFFRTGRFTPEIEAQLIKMVKRPMRNPVHTTVDEIGVFSTLVCDLSDEYEKMVYDLAKAGKLKWSSGTAPQLYEALPSGELKMFVIAEQALTPIPAEYRMLEHKVLPIKSYLEFLKGGPGSEFYGHAGRDEQNLRGGSVSRGQQIKNRARPGSKVKLKSEEVGYLLGKRGDYVLWTEKKPSLAVLEDPAKWNLSDAIRLEDISAILSDGEDWMPLIFRDL